MLPAAQNIFVPAAIGMPGIPELLVILGIVLVIFGPKKLPEIGKAIGQSIKELKKATDGKEEKKEEDEAPKQ